MLPGELEPITYVDGAVRILDQTRLPHDVVRRCLETLDDTAHAIRAMRVRGAPLIGVTAAYGMALAMRTDPSDANLGAAAETLLATRPTGVNLRRVIVGLRAMLASAAPADREIRAFEEADRLREEDISMNRAIGDHGLPILRRIANHKDGPVQVLTHCNAGILATAGYGTATAPMYRAFDEGLPLHVWVDETRPRNQGASLTAWELGQAGIPHTVIVDNAGGHLMQHGLVDVCIVGTDRTLVSGHVCNKIGTYLKALAAHDNGIPFYAAVPGLSIDWDATDPDAVPIEERDGREVAELAGVRLVPAGTPTANYGFDVTPARLVTGLITERGVCAASEAGLRGLYPEVAS
ncbi:MAG: S-methyl-5-thioribose-1-phosphate isomerase [Gemmatimonadota bacterium]|nr:S-methyl-5-thioribose-1-phosphate isomerase [Gemmatimonadota bacterium]